VGLHWGLVLNPLKLKPFRRQKDLICLAHRATLEVQETPMQQSGYQLSSWRHQQ
jgi:hypothetical protein